MTVDSATVGSQRFEMDIEAGPVTHFKKSRCNDICASVSVISCSPSSCIPSRPVCSRITAVTLASFLLIAGVAVTVLAHEGKISDRLGGHGCPPEGCQGNMYYLSGGLIVAGAIGIVIGGVCGLGKCLQIFASALDTDSI